MIEDDSNPFKGYTTLLEAAYDTVANLRTAVKICFGKEAKQRLMFLELADRLEKACVKDEEKEVAPWE